MLPLTVAYTIAFCAGLAYTTLLSRRFVFRSSAGRREVAQFVVGYLMVYGAGRLLLEGGRAVGGLPDWLLAGSVVLLTAPLSFLVGRWSMGAPHLLAPERPPRSAPRTQEGSST